MEGNKAGLDFVGKKVTLQKSWIILFAQLESLSFKKGGEIALSLHMENKYRDVKK